MPCPLIANADVIRVTRLDGCGRPVCGEDNGFVFDCFATLAMNAGRSWRGTYSSVIISEPADFAASLPSSARW